MPRRPTRLQVARSLINMHNQVAGGDYSYVQALQASQPSAASASQRDPVRGSGPVCLGPGLKSFPLGVGREERGCLHEPARHARASCEGVRVLTTLPRPVTPTGRSR